MINTINVIMCLLTFLGVVVAVIEIKALNKQREQHNEEARRRTTIEMIKFYTDRSTDELRYMERFIAGLSDDQCVNVYNHQAFEVDRNTMKSVCYFCCDRRKCQNIDNCLHKTGKDVYSIDGENLLHMRGVVIQYLNSLEIVLLAWKLGIVDRKIIVEQFSFLNKKRKRERALEVFRSIAGNGMSYPTIEEFYQYLDREQAKKAEESFKETID